MRRGAGTEHRPPAVSSYSRAFAQQPLQVLRPQYRRALAPSRPRISPDRGQRMPRSVRASSPVCSPTTSVWRSLDSLQYQCPGGRPSVDYGSGRTASKRLSSPLWIQEPNKGNHCPHGQYYKRLPNCSVGKWRASVSRGEPLEPMPQRVELCEDLYPLRQPFQWGGGPRAEEEHKEHRGADGLRGSRAKRQAAQKIAKAAQPGNQGEIEC